MSDTSFPYNETTNLGFITNPNIQDATLKANDRREQWLLGAYHYANSDRDEASRKASSAIFGDGTIPLSDKENSAYFLGDAILREHGYTGSPFAYFYANKLDLPPDVTDESTARIHIGNKLINEMRATYDERKKIEQDFAAIQNDLPTYLAEAVRTPSGSSSEIPNKEIASILNKAGAWTKMRPSIERARLAWLKTWSFFRNVDTMQSLTRGDLLELANELSDENGKLDELAMLAFSTALQQYATELQSTDINFFENWADSLQNVNAEKRDSKLRESKEGTLERLELLARTVETAKENGLSTEEATSMYEREVAALKDDRVNRLRGLMNAAMNIAMEPSEQASMLAKGLTSGGTLAGGMILPMVGSIAAGVLAKGKGGGFFSQAAAGYAGGFAASQDFIVNQAVMQAYFEGKENPETYGRLSGTGQAAAENVFGTGTSAFFLFKGVSKLATKAAAKSVTNKAFSNAIARGTLAYFGTTAIEGTGELMEEELGAYLGSKLNQLARATGTKVSEQEYTAWKTISEMPAHQVAAIYGMAAVLGIGGGIANYQKAQAWSMNVDNLRQSGFSDKAARDIVADGILHAEKVEEVKNSARPEEEKQLLLTNLQDERLEYLGKQFNKDILNASPEELNTRSKEENAKLLYKMLLAQAIKNGLDEQALINSGFTSGERLPNGNYLLTYLEKPKNEDGQPKLVQKEWNRDQLTGFLTFQQDTAIHKQLRELQSQIVAQQFAHSVESTSELAIRLANLRDTPLTELAAIRKHMAITIDLFREFARKEAANIAADVSAGMPLTQAEQQPSTILPNVARGSVLQLVEKAEARIENAIQTGEIKPGQPVHFPGINISALDGSGLVAFFSGKINLAQMLEEMFEIRLKQLRSTEDMQGMADTLKAIQSKLPGVKLLPGNKTTYTKDDIVEAYSHLAVAEVITNPAYYSHLTQAEQALINDVLANVNRAHKYKIIADAWQNYKNSEEGKTYLQQSGKDLMDIMQEAGFTFGKHFTTVQATEEQKTKLLAEHNFIPDFSQQTNRLLENAQAQQELEKQNQQEATEPTTIPASESVTGEEIVVTPEEKEAVAEPIELAEPAKDDLLLGDIIVKLSRAKQNVTETENNIARNAHEVEKAKKEYKKQLAAYKRLAKKYEGKTWKDEQEAYFRQSELDTALEYAESFKQDIATSESHVDFWKKKLEEYKDEVERLQKLYDELSPNTPHKQNYQLTDEEKQFQHLLTPQASVRDFALYLSKHRGQVGLIYSSVTTQNGEQNPNFVQGELLSRHVPSEQLENMSDAEMQERVKIAMVDEAIFDAVGSYTNSERIKIDLSLAKKQYKDARIESSLQEQKVERMTVSSDGKAGALPPAPKWTGISEAKQQRQTDQERSTAIAKSLKASVSTITKHDAANHVLHEVKNGQERWATTDRRRISIVSRASDAAAAKNLMSLKTGVEMSEEKAGMHFPNIDLAIPARYNHRATIDLAPYRALRKYKKAGDSLDIPGTKNPFVIYQPQEKGKDYKPVSLKAIYFRDAVEQLASLAKVLDFGSEVYVDYIDENSPIVFSAKRNGWEWKYILAPFKREGTQPGDIELSNKPAFIGVSELNVAQKAEANKALEEARAKTAAARDKVAEMEQKMKDVAELEKQLPEDERHARWFAAQLRHHVSDFHRKRVNDIRTKYLKGSLLEALLSPSINKYTSQLFTRITGIKLPMTVRGNEQVIKEWAPAEYRRATTKKDGGNFSVEELEKNGDTTASFSIAPMDDLGLRFAGEPIAVRMMNYIRDEGKRYSRNLGNKTSHDTAVNAIAHAQSIIGALDKYINTTKKPIRAADRARLGLLQRLIEKYAQIIKKGSTRSFAKIDPHEQEELIAAIQEAGAGIDWEAIEAIPTEEYNRIQQEVQNDLLPELYRKHAAAFANNLSAESYSTPADIRERMQALQQAAQTGHPNKNITPQDLTDSGYNSQPSADLKRDVLKQYASKQLSILQKSEEQNRKEFENAKTRTLQALQRIIKEGRIAENSTLGKAEQQQLTDAVEQEAQTQTEKETRKRVLDTYREQIKRDTEERYKQLVRTAAKGRVYQLLSEMLQDAGDILDNHLKADLVQKMKRITNSVAIKRTASKRLKGKLTAAGYRELQQAIVLMDMSARAKEDVQDDIDVSLLWLTTNAGEDIDTILKGPDLIKELADLIEHEGGTVTEASLNIALNNYRNAVLVFADLDSKNYMQTLQTANALALLINHHKSTWAALQERRTAEMKAYLDYFLANTTETSGTDNAIRKAVEKAKRFITFLPDSMMNTAQLFAALASYPALKPIFDDMRYNLANAQTAREVHLRNIRQQELAAFGRIIGMQPFNEAGYSEKQLQQISDKFDTFFMENNQVTPTDISITLFKDGKEHTYKWEGTKWEALGLILTYRQQHYQTNAEIHGYTPAVLQQLQNHIGEKLMSFGNAIQQIIVNDGTIQVYEEREGVPMQENPLYFPASININTINTTREEPLTSPYHPTAMHDFLHVRVKNTDEAKAKNAYLTYRSAIADRANYIYLDPITSNIDRLLAHREFSNRLASLIGPNLHKQLIKTIKEIKGAGYQETSLQDMTDSRLSQALSSSVLTLLPFNLGSYARQFSAVANAGLMPDISPVALVQYALKIRNDQGHISIPGILKLDAFTTRRRDNAFVNEVASMENNVKFSHLLKWTKTGLNWMDKLDVLANAFSAAIVYNHKYDQLKTMGELSEEDITKLCEQEVNAYVRLLAQPLNRVDKSALYWSLSGSALTRCLLFMGSESINKVGMLRSNYISSINNGRGHIMASLITIAKMGVTVGIGNFVIESMLALLSGNAPDDKDDSLASWLAAQYLNAAIGQYLDIMPVLGQFTRKLFNPYAKAGFKDLNIPGSNIDTYGGKLYKMLTDDKDYSGAEWQRQTTNFLREFTSILGYAGGAYSKWQIYSHVTAMLHNITAALNVGNIIARGAENGAFYADWLPEDYTKTNRRKRKRLKSGIERMLTPDSDTDSSDSSDTPTPLNISPELLKDYPDLAPYLQPKS